MITVLLTLLAFGAGDTGEERVALRGVLSDSMCVMRHESGAEGQETTPAECARDCVRGGSKYVLIVEKKVYTIANTDLDALAAHAGGTVAVEGTLAGDRLTVATIRSAAE